MVIQSICICIYEKSLFLKFSPNKYDEIGMIKGLRSLFCLIGFGQATFAVRSITNVQRILGPDSLFPTIFLTSSKLAKRYDMQIEAPIGIRKFPILLRKLESPTNSTDLRFLREVFKRSEYPQA